MQECESDLAESGLTLDSEIGELVRLAEFVERFCKLQCVPKEICYQLQLALEELILNTIKYGGCEPKEGAIQLTMSRVGDEVCVVLRDRGIRFNPLETSVPDVTGSLDDRPVGGLGIHLVRQLMSSIRYERRAGQNYLYLTKPLRNEPGTASLDS